MQSSDLNMQMWRLVKNKFKKLIPQIPVSFHIFSIQILLLWGSLKLIDAYITKRVKNQVYCVCKGQGHGLPVFMPWVKLQQG